MNYHLNRNGQHLGVFSLEELRQRRTAGELTGNELVWRPGMTNWQLLGDILQQSAAGILPPPIPASARKSNPAKVAIFVAVVIGVVLAAIAVSTITIKKAVLGFNTAFHQAQRTSYGIGGEKGVAVASQPVLVSSNSLTSTQVREREREFRTRQYLTGYQLRGEHNPATDALASRLLEAWVIPHEVDDPDTNVPPLNELADQLATNPICTDPLVLSVTGDIALELHSATNRLERAVKGFENSGHLGYPKFYATVLLGNKIFGNREWRLSILDALAVKRFREALADGSIQAADQPGIAEQLLSRWGEHFFERDGEAMVNAVKERGQTYAWLALTLEGQRQINEAWKARGDGYANSVTAAGWEGFNNHLALARDALARAWELQPGWPQAPGLMMTVALGNSDLDEMRTWFDRAVAAQIDYAPAWSSMRWGLRPRWYGSEAAMLALGVTALNTHRFDTDVPLEYFKAVNDIGSEQDLAPGEHLYGRADLWPNLQAMYEGYVAATHGDAQRGWRGNFAAAAYLSGRPQVARQQLVALNWQPDHSSLTGWDRDLSLMAPEIAARTGAQSIQVNRAETCRQKNDFAGALKIYHELAAVSLEPPERKFVEERLLSLETERRLRAGEWVNFLPTSNDFAGWQIERGQCRVEPDGALAVHTDINGHLLYSRARVGTSFEVRGQFELVHSTDRQFQGGLVVGIPEFYTQDWYAFRIKRTTADGDTANFSQHWTLREVRVPALIHAGTNTFWFSFQEGHVTATVNGRPVLDNVDPPQDSDVVLYDTRLGFGAFSDANITDIRYRNVQVHLTGKP